MAHLKTIILFTYFFLNFGVIYRMYQAAGWTAEEWGCVPLLTTKYEPDMVKTDRDIEVGKWRFFDCLRKVPCWWYPCGRCESRIYFRFLFPVGLDVYGDILGNAYFLSDRCSKVPKKIRDLPFQQGKLWLGTIKFFAITKKQEVGNEATASEKVIYCKFNNFATACRIGSIFEGNVGDKTRTFPEGRPHPLQTFKKIKINTFGPLVRLTPQIGSKVAENYGPLHQSIPITKSVAVYTVL